MIPKVAYAPRMSEGEKREICSVTISPLVKYQATLLAHEFGQSLSNLVEDALRAYIKVHLDGREPNVGGE
jgi:hypothetical protein